MGDYCTVQEIRCEGFTDVAEFPNSRITAKIAEASRYIEAITGRFFEPRTQVLKVDAHGTKDLLLEHPIINITEVRILGQDIASQDVILESDEFVFYNRHLSQGLLNPDDRDNPKISLIRLTDNALSGIRTTFRAGVVFGAEFFPFGVQNIQVSGKFGYTDIDTAVTPDPDGITPLLIKKACMLLTIRELPPARDIDCVTERRRNDIIEERVRDQTIRYRTGKSARIGGIIGDPEIDDILARFTRPFHLGAA